MNIRKVLIYFGIVLEIISVDPTCEDRVPEKYVRSRTIRQLPGMPQLRVHCRPTRLQTIPQDSVFELQHGGSYLCYSSVRLLGLSTALRPQGRLYDRPLCKCKV